MINQLIAWSVRNRLIVLVLTVGAIGAGVWALTRTPLEALPDLSDVQVIVQTDFSEQAPRIVEDQVTYPIAAEMLKVPGARTVRGYSYFGVSFVYVIFDDGTDLYWARTRVLEYLSGLRDRLPSTVSPTLGPDATGLGWVYQYALEDTTGRMTLAEMRSVQDWQLRFALTAVPGVSEVASIGGFEKQYQVDLDPERLRAYGIPVTRVMAALQNANADVGAMVMELSEREYMIRGLGYLSGLADIENVTVAAGTRATPVRIADVGRVNVGPAPRRGIADLDGRGEAVGGIVVMRSGSNARTTINAVKAKLAEVSASLPPGLVVRAVYDRSALIDRSIATLREKLIEESIVVAVVCVVFLLHASSSLVAILTLPIGILLAFVAMRGVPVGADIMSLGGIAIAIGAMIDAAIVMIENLHRNLERAIDRKTGGRLAAQRSLHTRELTTGERWQVVLESAQQVGPALFFSLLIITVSFLPVFALTGQEGRLFRPLAYTKTFAMAAASLLSVTLVPATMGLFIRGRIHRDMSNPVTRAMVAVYRPMVAAALRYRGAVMTAATAVLVLTWVPWQRIGSEFMPPLEEGTILFMPTTLPGVSVARAREILATQDRILASFPEVASVWGKAGRAETATDPAGFDMVETTITLKPRSEWREGMTMDDLVAAMDSAVRLPGVTNAWTMPIKGRMDMLATGIRTPVGIKVFGPDLDSLERVGRDIERVVRMVPGTRTAFAERAGSGYYLDIDIDREKAARYGLNVGDAQAVIASAIGGMVVTQTVEGRARYGVRVRYPQELRDSPEKLATVLVPVSMGGTANAGGAAMAGSRVGAGRAMGNGAMSGPSMVTTGSGGAVQVPLGQFATIRPVSGPMVVRTEGAQLTAWVYVDITESDVGRYVQSAQAAVARDVMLPAGYYVTWSGQYEYMERAKATMRIVVPATLALVFLLLLFTFRNATETLIVMLTLPFAVVGGLWYVWLLGYNWSVAVAVGFIALAGVAAETGVVMLIYLDHAWQARVASGRSLGVTDVYEAVMEGAVDRVRPKMMTVAAIVAGLVPIMWSTGTGASVMKRIAAPMIGGMATSAILTLIVIPIVYSLWKERGIRAVRQELPAAPAATPHTMEV